MALSILSQYEHVQATILEYLDSIRQDLYDWMQQLVDVDTGGVRMHVDGEIDVRASYCEVSICQLLNVPLPAAATQLIQFVQNCQTWEGGFGGEPGAEVHGGYTYCAVATLRLLDSRARDEDSLVDWLSRRQLSYEGGFSGRTNKLVDGCYSFWQGAASHLVGDTMDAPMLQRYVLLCGQDVNGGLRDKPSKPRDFYHTCYCLSGLSIAQQVSQSRDGGGEDSLMYGSPEASRVAATHPCFNIRPEHVERVQAYFADKPL